MSPKLRELLEQFVPFVVLGIAITLAIGLFFILFHAIFWGIVLGGIIWLAMVIKQYLFPNNKSTKPDGRIIEHNDNDK